MSFVERILCKVFRYRDILRDGKLYLRRFYLTPRTWRWRLFLHHIVLPDADPHVHDHPWPFWTWVTRRWYREWTEAPCTCTNVWPNAWGLHEVHIRANRVSWFGYRPAAYRHRIITVPPGGAWTLVLAGRAEREWGFWVDGKWQPWYQYLNCPNETAPEDRVR